MCDTRHSLCGRWLWEPGPLKVFVAAFALVPCVLAIAFFPLLGVKALAFLGIAWAGLLMGIVYGLVGRKVRAVRKTVSTENGEGVDGLIVRGMIQSPGIVLLTKDELLLAPIVGKRVTVPLADIKSVRETTWFNGTMLFWKKGFWLKAPGTRRLGFAVSDSAAGLFRSGLARGPGLDV